MPDIVTDTSPTSMARCIEENMIACFAALAAQGDAMREEDGITTVVTGIPISDFNGVFRTQLPPDLPPEQIDERIAATVRGLDAAGVPYAWHVFPSARPSALAGHLRAHGFGPAQTFPGMAADLQALDESAPMPTGLEIVQVRDDAALRTWIQASFVGFGMPATLQEVFYAAMSQFELSADAPWQFYLGQIDGRPVATSFGLMMAGVVGLYTIATEAEQRGKGIGTVMTLAPLREARDRGYRIGILEASTMGFPVYERLGFHQYITIEHYERADGAQ
jgi:GNAT superfamily N-acetyltransferase